MKDEIKEILETINDLIKIASDKGSYAMSYKMWKQLLDYITNLQEENKDYKSRIEKAIEYIHNHQLVFELSSKKQIQYWFDMFYKDLINILSGVDKE